MHKYRMCKFMVAVFLFSGLSVGYLNAAVLQSLVGALSAKSAERIAGALMSSKTAHPFSFQDYQSFISTFISKSEQSHSLDWSLFRLMNTSNLGITFDSHAQYLSQCAIKEINAIGQDSTAQHSYYPVVFPFEEAKLHNFQLPDTLKASSELGLMFNQLGLRSSGFASQPYFHAETSIGSNARFSFTISPMAQESALQQRIIQIERTWAIIREVIAKNPELNARYTKAVFENADLLKSMILAKNPAELVKAQFSVNSLDLIPAFAEGQVLMDEIRPRLQNFFLLDGYGNAALSLEQRGQLLQIIAPFFEHMSVTFNKSNIYPDFLQDCINAEIPNAQLLLDRHQGKNSWGDSFSCMMSSFLPSYAPPAIDTKIQNNQFFRDFSILEKFCSEQRFEESKALVDLYRSRISTADDGKIALSMCNEMQALSLTHDYHYHQIYNNYDIKYEHTDDPYYALGKHLFEACTLDKKNDLMQTMRQTILVRQQKLQDLFSLLNTDGKNSRVRSLGYQLIDAQSPQEIVQILSPLAADHPEADCRLAYSVFIEQYSPKWIARNNTLASIAMPKELAQIENTQARLLYGLCMTHEQKTKEQELLLGQALGYISKSCANNPLAKKYLYLAEKLYQSVNDGNVSDAIRLCPNFNEIFHKEQQANLVEQLITSTVQCLEKIDAIKADTNSKVEDLRAVLSDIKVAFEDLQSEKIEIVNQWLEKVISPAIEAGSISKELARERSLLLNPTKSLKEIIIQNACNIYGEERLFQQCAMPEYENDWVYGDEIPFNNITPAFDVSLPSLIVAHKLFGCGSEEKELIDLDKIPQCNWGKKKQLPSFGEAPAVEGKEKAQEATTKENEGIKEQEKQKESVAESEHSKEKNIEKELEKLKKEIIKDKVINQEQEKQLDDFLERLRDLISKYGIGNVLEACEVSNLSLYKVKKGTVIIAINELASALSEINADQQTRAFKYEHSQNGKVTRSSIQEAIAGKACIDQCLLGIIKRAELEGDDFIEIETEKKWDVKTARSKSLDGEDIFDIEEFARSLQDGYADGENIIIQITNLSEEDLEIFYQSYREKFTFGEFERTIIVDGKNKIRSKSTKDLIKFMRDL